MVHQLDEVTGITYPSHWLTPGSSSKNSDSTHGTMGIVDPCGSNSCGHRRNRGKASALSGKNKLGQGGLSFHTSELFLVGHRPKSWTTFLQRTMPLQDTGMSEHRNFAADWVYTFYAAGIVVYKCSIVQLESVNLRCSILTRQIYSSNNGWSDQPEWHLWSRTSMKSSNMVIPPIE